MVRLSPGEVDAVVLDLDGVLTDTAGQHERAWRELFDPLLAGRPADVHEDHRPFTHEDYLRHVDGRPRIDGLVGFLASRGVEVPSGTARTLAERKDARYQELLRTEGVTLLPGAVALLQALRHAGVRTGVVSASRSCAQVLRSAGLTGLVDAVVDGVTASALGLAGKPDPATYLEAARRLGARPGRTVVVEDALPGVQAGRRGGFLLVVGVDRTGHGSQLLAHGADAVVRDLTDVEVGTPEPTGRPIP